MRVDIGLRRCPEASMAPEQVVDSVKLDDPTLRYAGQTKTIRQYLDEHCSLTKQDGPYELYGNGNTWYVVDTLRRIVFFAVGFHGPAVFDALVEGREEDIWLRVHG